MLLEYDCDTYIYACLLQKTTAFSLSSFSSFMLRLLLDIAAVTLNLEISSPNFPDR